MHAGANVAGSIYQPHITSYDYDCPISEAGGVGQPGIGGDNKYKVRSAEAELALRSRRLDGCASIV